MQLHAAADETRPKQIVDETYCESAPNDKCNSRENIAGEEKKPDNGCENKSGSDPWNKRGNGRHGSPKNRMRYSKNRKSEHRKRALDKCNHEVAFYD